MYNKLSNLIKSSLRFWFTKQKYNGVFKAFYTLVCLKIGIAMQEKANGPYDG